MKKLHLDTDALRVESFEPQRALPGAGTVRAHATFDTCIDTPCDPVPPDYTEPPCNPPTANTCAVSCWGSCFATCGCPNTRVGWTCDPFASECFPIPEQ